MVTADVVSPTVHLHVLLTAWQFGDWAADVAFGLQLAGLALYGLGVLRLRRRGRRWRSRRTLSFLAGVLVLMVALVSGLSSYDNSVFLIHISQHLLLMMVAPPLLALGAPVTLALQASGRTATARIIQLMRSRTAVLLASPMVAAGLYYGFMYLDLLSPFYHYSLVHPLVHDASHLAIFSLGCLFWWPILGVDRFPGRVHFGLRLASLGLGMPFEVFLGIALLSMRSPIAPQHSLADTHLGGGAFWVSTMTINFLAALVVLSQRMRQDERLAARLDRGGGSSEADHERWASAWMARTGAVPPTDSGPAGQSQ
ncbi:MAG: cytochrome c oxidase assembly protein [Acidimicrobiales bacterium]